MEATQSGTAAHGCTATIPLPAPSRTAGCVRVPLPWTLSTLVAHGVGKVHSRSVSSSPHITALLFDLGGVLINVSFDEAFRSWSDYSPLSPAEMRARFRMDRAYKMHERGQISAHIYFDHLRRCLRIHADDDAIASGWNAIYLGTLDKAVECLMEVKDRLPCYAFTNSNPVHQAAWMALYPGVVRAFRAVFVSSDIGTRKPERSAFHSVCRRMDVVPSQVLFFDDSQENVRGARAAGLNAVQVRAETDLRDSLRRFGAL